MPTFARKKTAGRLVAHEKIAEADLLEARRKADALESRRHLWKFEVEGWGQKISLREVDQAIKNKQTEKLDVLFIRPSRRALIQSHIEYLREVKGDIQKQLAERGNAVTRRPGAPNSDTS